METWEGINTTDNNYYKEGFCGCVTYQYTVYKPRKHRPIMKVKIVNCKLK